MRETCMAQEHIFDCDAKREVGDHLAMISSILDNFAELIDWVEINLTIARAEGSGLSRGKCASLSHTGAVAQTE